MGSFLRDVRVHTRVVTMVTNPSPFAQDFLSFSTESLVPASSVSGKLRWLFT